MSDQPSHDLLPRLTWMPDVYREEPGCSLTPLQGGRMPLIRHRSMKSEKFDFDVAGEAAAFTAGAQNRISGALRNLQALDNKGTVSFLNRLTAAGLNLDPVYPVTNAWNFIVGGYGYILIVKTDRGWREILSHCPIQQKASASGSRDPESFYSHFQPGKSGFIKEREAGTHHEVLEPPKTRMLPSDVRDAVGRHMVEAHFLQQLVNSSESSHTLILGDESCIRHEFELAGLITTPSKVGAVFSRGVPGRPNDYWGDEAIFVPWDVDKSRKGWAHIHVRLDEAFPVIIGEGGENLGAAWREKEKTDGLENAVRSYFERPEFPARVNCDFMLVSGPR